MTLGESQKLNFVFNSGDSLIAEDALEEQVILLSLNKLNVYQMSPIDLTMETIKEEKPPEKLELSVSPSIFGRDGSDRPQVKVLGVV